MPPFCCAAERLKLPNQTASIPNVLTRIFLAPTKMDHRVSLGKFMTISLEVRAELIRAAIQEDRVEIRLIKDRVYSNVTLITVSSFAITAFLLGKDVPKIHGGLLPLIDASFLVMLWVVFWRLKTDLDICHVCLESREDMLRNLPEEDRAFDVFRRVEAGRKPKISENGLYWIVSMATLALVAKFIVVSWGMF